MQVGTEKVGMVVAPIPYRNNVINKMDRRMFELLKAPIPYRNNVIDIATSVGALFKAPIPYRNNVMDLN